MGEEYTVRNYMVDLLSSLLPSYLEEHFNEFDTYAHSPEFINKLKAMTLNRVPPLYITSVKGEVFSAYAVRAHQYSADITVALAVSAAELLAQLKDGA